MSNNMYPFLKSYLEHTGKAVSRTDTVNILIIFYMAYIVKREAERKFFHNSPLSLTFSVFIHEFIFYFLDIENNKGLDYSNLIKEAEDNLSIAPEYASIVALDIIENSNFSPLTILLLEKTVLSIFSLYSTQVFNHKLLEEFFLKVFNKKMLDSLCLLNIKELNQPSNKVCGCFRDLYYKVIYRNLRPKSMEFYRFEDHFKDLRPYLHNPEKNRVKIAIYILESAFYIIQITGLYSAVKTKNCKVANTIINKCIKELDPTINSDKYEELIKSNSYHEHGNVIQGEIIRNLYCRILLRQLSPDTIKVILKAIRNISTLYSEISQYNEENKHCLFKTDNKDIFDRFLMQFNSLDDFVHILI